MHLVDLQSSLPWSGKPYSPEFRANRQGHKDFAHALLHAQKALGKLAIPVEEADHVGSDPFERVEDYLADLVISALRMANTCPSHNFSLETAVIRRLDSKNGTTWREARYPTEPTNA